MISVIVPTYNNALILSESLLTWIKQTISPDDYEIIVVNNNSIDNTVEVICKYASEHKHIHYLLETKLGATNARHAGAGMAKGDILVFADDDGLYNQDCLNAIIDAFNKMPKVEAVACRINILWDKPAPDWIKPYAFMQGELNYGSELMASEDLYFNSGLFAIKKATFEELHGFNPDLIGGKLIGDGDTGLVIKMWEAHKLIGWTPYACMQHMQQVDKHGTEKGIALHFYNNGVGDAYAVFRKNNFRFTFPVVKYYVLAFVFYAKKLLEYYLLNKKDRKIYFSLQQRKGQLAFFSNLCDKDLRKEIYKRDLYEK